jgi:predicted secreted protein
MTASANNPQKGDLVRWARQTDIGVQQRPPFAVDETPWIVLDFFPWGCYGKHAWAIQNTVTGDRRVVFKYEITLVKE